MISLRKIKASPLYKRTWPAVKAVHGKNADWTARKIQQYITGEYALSFLNVNDAFAWAFTDEGIDFWYKVSIDTINRESSPKKDLKRQELTVLL